MSPALGLAIALVSYLVGSIPFSYLVARHFGVDDVRKVGSGNVGATNVMRAAGPIAGLLALALDGAKGALAVTMAHRLSPLSVAGPLAAVAVVLGHVFSPWLGFRGGKGVATGAGALFPIAPLATVAGLLMFALTAAWTRYVSLGSILGAFTLAGATFLRPAPRALRCSAVLVALVILWTHRGNLARLTSGSERRLGGGAR